MEGNVETELDLQKIRIALEKQQKILIKRTKTDNVIQQNSKNPDQSYFQKQRDRLLFAKDHQKLVDIGNALTRIENGKFGICDHCGQTIHPIRLETIPTTTRCIKCKKDHK